MKEFVLSIPHFVFGLVIGSFIVYFAWNLIAHGLTKRFSEASTLFFLAIYFLFVVIYTIITTDFNFPFVLGGTISSLVIGKSLLKSS